MNFDIAFDRLIGNEGGLVDNPNDPGGLTQWGISQRSYPNVDIKKLTREGAKAIYLKDFWLIIDADPAIKFQVFDFAVNSGVQTAIRKLQAAIGVADDGHWGAVSGQTLLAMPVAQVLLRFIAQRIRFWTSLTTWPTFGKGWANRAATDLDYAAGDL